jgi:hypothetical protein
VLSEKVSQTTYFVYEISSQRDAPDVMYFPMKKSLPEKEKTPSTFFFQLFAFGFDEVASHEGCRPQHTQHCKYGNTLHSWLCQKDSQATSPRRHCVDGS